MKKFLKRVLIALGVFALLIAVLYAGWDISSRRKLAAAKERIRAAGLPLTVDDIRSPPVPDTDNAALVLAKIEPMLDAISVSGSDKFEWKFSEFQTSHVAYKLDPDGIKQLAALLEITPVQEIMSLIKRGSVMKSYDTKIADQVGMIWGSSPTSVTRAARLVGWHTRLAASRGQVEEAYADVWAMINLAELLEKEPGLASQFARWVVWRRALRELERMSAICALPADWNQKLADRLAGMDFFTGYARGLDADRITVGEFYYQQLMSGQLTAEKIYEDLPSREGPIQLSWGQRLVLLQYRLPARLRVEYASYIDRLHEGRAIVAQRSLGFREMVEKIQRVVKIIPENHALTKLGLPPLKHNVESIWQLQAKIIAAQTGLALERYRAANGGYPVTLAELVPEFLPKVPEDVFIGGPLIYRPEPGGAIIYSVGPNRHDDGGVDDRIEKDDPSWFAGAAAARYDVADE